MLVSRRTIVVRGALGLWFAPPLCQAYAQSSADWAVAFSEALNADEAEASKLGLPRTDRTRAGTTVKLTEENAYIEGMPRLVDLLERSSSSPNASDLANDASKLLSDLNDRERVPPDHFTQPGGTRGPRPSLDALRKDYLTLFKSCNSRPEFVGTVNWHVQTISRFSSRYKQLASVVSIPWYFIAIVHGLEASFNFGAHLHNGDRLTQRTVHIPRNKPDKWLPPSDWRSSAIDALQEQGFVGKSDWSLERMLYRWESYNGFGYRSRGVHTPYLWSFSNNYSSGKFVKDGHYDRKAVSKQCGAAVMLKGLVNAGLVTL
ncbi:exported hypothetical protein [Mesorhizobium prunaredense]|uniref:Uncharacterized protein n=1 Tax=Mesorhizobium prunaredense TaxID=1631249 RepID=A0A1R3VHP4_9HYPH|nr:exported hypothetical protein [Mesorhizobium prunaredense]